jgi:Arc/MetJ-type ribon-helix-helix transcriptional regulator
MYDEVMSRRRLSVSVDEELIKAAKAAVATGRVENVSVWVNDALRRQADHDRRLAALDEFLAEYEAEHGEITESEMNDAARRVRAQAIVVRGEAGVA